MRMMYRMKTAKVDSEDLALVEDVLYSPIFIYFDIFLLSLISSYLLFPYHQSIFFAFLIFIGFGALGLGLFQQICKWSKAR